MVAIVTMVLSFASFGTPHRLLGPTLPRISRTSLRAMEQRKKAAPDTPPPVEKKEIWPHVYQRINEDKQYHALEDYFWFYEEWSMINKRFVKYGKKLQYILMELQYMHRVKEENKVVMDNVKKLEDHILPDNWEASLHGSADTIPTNEWRGFMFPDNKLVPDWKPVERIGYADKVLRYPHTYFEHSDAHLKKKKGDWARWEKYCAIMEERLRNKEPHYPEFPYLKVFGERLRRRSPKDYSFVCKE